MFWLQLQSSVDCGVRLAQLPESKTFLSFFFRAISALFPEIQRNVDWGWQHSNKNYLYQQLAIILFVTHRYIPSLTPSHHTHTNTLQPTLQRRGGAPGRSRPGGRWGRSRWPCWGGGGQTLSTSVGQPCPDHYYIKPMLSTNFPKRVTQDRLID